MFHICVIGHNPCLPAGRCVIRDFGSFSEISYFPFDTLLQSRYKELEDHPRIKISSTDLPISREEKNHFNRVGNESKPQRVLFFQ
jgi:hypothetical protein